MEMIEMMDFKDFSNKLEDLGCAIGDLTILAIEKSNPITFSDGIMSEFLRVNTAEDICRIFDLTLNDRNFKAIEDSIEYGSLLDRLCEKGKNGFLVEVFYLEHENFEFDSDGFFLSAIETQNYVPFWHYSDTLGKLIDAIEQKRNQFFDQWAERERIDVMEKKRNHLFEQRNIIV